MADIKHTDEQVGIINSKAEHLVVTAYAGTGKTSTMEAFTRAQPPAQNDRRTWLYLAYNKSIAEEAKGRFPEWVECRTTHSLAYGAVIPRLFADIPRDRVGEKLGDMRPMQIAQRLEVNPRMAGFVKAALESWFGSADEKILPSHIPADLKVPEAQVPAVLEYARKLFASMCDPKDRQATLPHDGYLKIWSLQGPDLSRRYFGIVIDEAQDTNPATLSVLLKQKTRIVMVGDANQAIYQFRGAINAMDSLPGAERHYLTNSFRFGHGIARTATSILRPFRDMPKPISGLAPLKTEFQVDRTKPFAVIARTNAALFAEAVKNIAGQKPFHFVGGTRGYKFDLMMDCYHLLMNQKGAIKSPTVRQFNSMEELKKAGEEAKDPELKFLGKIADEYGERIPELIREIEDRHVPLSAPAKLKDGIIFTTAHKAKGLEFDQVVLTDDYAELVDENQKNFLHGDDVPDEAEINLLYVAATRAKRNLQVNESIRNIFHVTDALRERQESHVASMRI